jgi:hypothetical protein
MTCPLMSMLMRIRDIPRYWAMQVMGPFVTTLAPTALFSSAAESGLTSIVSASS